MFSASPARKTDRESLSHPRLDGFLQLLLQLLRTASATIPATITESTRACAAKCASYCFLHKNRNTAVLASTVFYHKPHDFHRGRRVRVLVHATSPSQHKAKRPVGRDASCRIVTICCSRLFLRVRCAGSVVCSCPCRHGVWRLAASHAACPLRFGRLLHVGYYSNSNCELTADVAPQSCYTPPKSWDLVWPHITWSNAVSTPNRSSHAPRTAPI